MNMAAVPPQRLPGAPRLAILLVEDNVLVGMAAAEMLEGLGYAVRRVTTGHKALELLDQHAEIALMVADVGLPDIDGHQLAARARQRRPGLRVLFITGYDRPVGPRTPADAITAYLEKPYFPAALDAALSRLLAAA